MTFQSAERIADAVLYEGYLLYPYRASSAKNQVRWQFGVVVPHAAAARDGSERWRTQTEVLVAPAGGASLRDAVVDVRVRYLHLQARTVEELAEDGEYRQVERLELTPSGRPPSEVPGLEVLPWDEAIEESIDHPDLRVADLLASERRFEFRAEGGQEIEPVLQPDGSPAGRIVRTRRPMVGAVVISAADLGSNIRVRVAIENTTPEESAGDSGRQAFLPASLLSAHTLLRVRGGHFLSLLDPPADAKAPAAACVNEGTWPVLVGEPGEASLMLSSPIILYDYPQIAPESPGDLFDGTEIDEILTLRILTMTDDEKREARATDPRAARIMERSEEIPPEVFERLHGAIRSLGPSSQAGPDPALAPRDDAAHLPFWEPEARVPPEEATIEVQGTAVSRGSRVVLRPAPRRDTMDLFLAGRVATVTGVFESVDDEVFVAVTVDDDPAAELHDWYGRYFYFRPDELEPQTAGAGIGT